MLAVLGWGWLLANIEAQAHPGGHERIQEVEKAALQGPCPAEGFVERGVIWGQMGHTNEALADFARARACDPEVATLDREEARMWLNRDDPTRAIPLLEAHLRNTPRDAQGLALMAGARSALGDWEAATLCWSLALEPSPRWTPDHVLAWADTMEFSEGPQAALELVRRAMERAPGSPAMENRRIELDVLLGAHSDALARLDARVAARPRQLDTWIWRGDVLLAMGRADEARQSWKEVQRRWEDFPQRLKNPRTRASLEQARRRLGESAPR